jgi:hypothetical protein
VLLHEYKNVFNEVSRIEGLKNKIRFLFSKPGSVFIHYKRPDHGKQKIQAEIYYSPLKKII